jgi:polysaccharide biosynthesis protein PelA
MRQTHTHIMSETSAARTFCFLCALFLTLLLPGDAHADEVKRRILAIYDSAFETVPDQTLVHLWAEMPLNHMGYIVDYQDAAKALPDPQSVTQYAAIITWFTYDVTRTADYLIWARRVADRRVPFIVFGQIGVPATPQNLASANQILRPMGIAYTSNFVEATNGTRILLSDASVIGFERKLENILPGYPAIKRLSSEAGVALEVQAPARERSVRSALVTAGPGGAFVPSAFALNVDPAIGRSQWIVDPFAVFERVLGSAPFPIPDTATVSGRRLYFSHVDGDGWNDSVEMERYNTPPMLAAEVVERELIAPYPDLPVTVGLITADLDPAYGNGAKAAEAARRLFNLPQVEPASHSATVPLVWADYEFKSRADGEKPPDTAPRADGAASWLIGVTEALGIRKAVAQSGLESGPLQSAAPGRSRVHVRDPFSLNAEIFAAADQTSEVAPAGKRARLYTWTGDAKPFGKAVEATRIAGLRNMNGGGARFDSNFPSISYVTPIARQTGGERQIYSVSAGDSSFADTANGSLGGFAKLSETFDATELPRRLKGAHLHYHIYSAKKQASLSAVKRHLDWARSARLTPVTASDYASIADGFFTTRIDKTGPMQWSVTARDGLQTLRFDNADALSVNVAESQGVIGSTLYQGSLYVALDSSVPEALIALQSADAGIAMSSAKPGAQLEQASWKVRDLKRSGCGFSFTAQGYGAGQFEWKDLDPAAYHVAAASKDGPVWGANAAAGHEGRLMFEIPASAVEPLTIKVSCTSEKEEGRL